MEESRTNAAAEHEIGSSSATAAGAVVAAENTNASAANTTTGSGSGNGNGSSKAGNHAAVPTSTALVLATPRPFAAVFGNVGSTMAAATAPPPPLQPTAAVPPPSAAGGGEEEQPSPSKAASDPTLPSTSGSGASLGGAVGGGGFDEAGDPFGGGPSLTPSSSSTGSVANKGIAHRPAVFDKLEQLVRDMQDSEHGVPVRCQRGFLTSIPAAFMGYDLIEWLMDRLSIEDSRKPTQPQQPITDSVFLYPADRTVRSGAY